MSFYAADLPILKYKNCDILYFTNSASVTKSFTLDVVSAQNYTGINSLFIAGNVLVSYSAGIKFVNPGNHSNYLQLRASSNLTDLLITNGSSIKYLATKGDVAGVTLSYVDQSFANFRSQHPSAYIISAHYREYGDDTDTLYPVIWIMDYDGSYSYTLYYFTGSA